MRTARIGLALVLAVFLVIGCLSPKSGLIKHSDGTQDGYTLLMVVELKRGTALGSIIIDMQGNKVHQYSSVRGGRMMPGGAILGFDRIVMREMAAVAVVQEAWDGTEEWSYSNWDEVPTYGWIARAHHDVQRQGDSVGYYAPGNEATADGNTLVLARADVTRPDIFPGLLLDDVIYEVDWDGKTVFTWYASDHVDELGFDDVAREGIYSSHIPGWLHCNAVSWLGENHWYDEGDARFHPKNMLLSSRHAGFMVIIDHITGDIVWRVGPDYSAGNPESALKPIIGQHQPHMIPQGLPGAGNILVFDNGGASGWNRQGWMKYMRTTSRVLEFDPVTLEIVWQTNLFPASYLLGSAQRLPNGNTLITTGTALSGTVLEMTPYKRIVWEFINPFFARDNPAVYRAYRLPPEWMPEGVNPGEYPPWGG